MKKNNLALIVSFMAVLMMLNSIACAEEQEDYKILREIVIHEFSKETPIEQGSDLSGVLRQFKTEDRKISIILGACLDQGAELDDELFQKFQAKQIPVSLFVDQGWLHKNSEKVKKILTAGNVALENHGLNCRSLSVVGKGLKGHPGTAGVDEAFEEIEKNAREIELISGRLPRFYKSGYDFYDDVSLKVLTVLGYVAIQGDLKLRSSDVLNDASLKSFLEKVRPGSIILIPANRPNTSNGWAVKLLDGLSRGGYQIAALDDVINTEEESR